MLQGGDERVLNGLLREGEVAESADERGGDPAGLLPENGRQCRARIAQRAISMIGRTSTVLWAGQSLANCRASSRSWTSMMA